MTTQGSDERRLLISFSGGETSAHMTWLLLRRALEYDVIQVVFANTGEEWEVTLEFVRDCDDRLGFGTVWVEGVQYPGERRGPGYRVVTFETASRHGEPFEAAIAKYGIPNTKFKDCTRNLKRKVIEAYARDGLGWAPGSYDLAIGIRVDEVDRVSSEAAARRLVYPLIKRWPRTKQQVNGWWSLQNFRLRLKGYQGNCKWCWKKSLRKHLTIIGETPKAYDFPRRMERRYGLVGPEFKKDPALQRDPLPPGYRRRFFRGNLTVADLAAERRRRVHAGTFEPATDDHLVLDLELDLADGCEESCEVFGPDDEDEAA